MTIPLPVQTLKCGCCNLHHRKTANHTCNLLLLKLLGALGLRIHGVLGCFCTEARAGVLMQREKPFLVLHAGAACWLRTPCLQRQLGAVV